MDNFEWTDGYSVRFGMVYIDYANDQKRYIKDSANWYSQLIHNSTITAFTEFEGAFEMEEYNDTEEKGKTFLSLRIE